MSAIAVSQLIAALMNVQPGPLPGANQLHVYPQSPGCTTTLQACIDNAIAGDIIDIASESPIDEDLIILNSLVLRAAPDVFPVIGGGAVDRSVAFTVPSFAPDPSRSVSIEGLTFINTRVTSGMLVGSGHRFEFRNNAIRNESGGNGAMALLLRLEVAGDIVVEDNVIESAGTGISFQTRDEGVGIVSIQRNRLTTNTPASSADGIFLDLDLDPVGSGDVQVNVLSNVAYGTGGFGFAGAGIRAIARSQTNLNLSHNTVYGVGGIANGIDVDLGDASTGMLNLFKNSVSAGAGAGYRVISRAAGGAVAISLENNHSFGNGQADFLWDITANMSLGEIALSADPTFVNPAGADFALSATSPLIDVGTNNASQGSLSPDANGAARPAGASSDVGALEFEGEPLQLFSRVELFTSAPMGVVVSAPYPGPVNGPPEPFVSGQISLDAVAPSTLFFDDWIPDPVVAEISGGINPPSAVMDLALNGNENLIIRSTVGLVLGMGIEFNDVIGGSSPSTFTLTALNAGTIVGQKRFRTPGLPSPNFAGLWSPVPFDELQITELPIANENEFFGQVLTSQQAASLQVFSDGFE